MLCIFVLDVNFEVNCFCRKVYPNENMPGALNTSMFIPALENLADDELKKNGCKRHTIMKSLAHMHRLKWAMVLH